MQQSVISKSSSRIFNSYKDAGLAKELLNRIRACAQEITIMEVCGTHTVSLFRSGIRGGLPKSIRLVSGPGCPVCVTPAETLEKAVYLSAGKNNVLFCFGDMMKVPARNYNLEESRARSNANVRIMYSPMEALDYARQHNRENVILLGVGFETTIPLFASVLVRAREERISNLYLLSDFKLVPPALEALLSAGAIGIDGFMLPGHVSTIIGEDAYGFMIDKHKTSGVICGFEPVDMLQGILLIIEMVRNKEPAIKNEYSRYVSRQGNLKAKSLIYAVFEDADAKWRGLGTISMSGLRLKKEFSAFSAEALIDCPMPEIPEPKGCMCGKVIKGECSPLECKLFKSACTVAHPVGPCMVSSEGTCAAYYKYGGNE